MAAAGTLLAKVGDQAEFGFKHPVPATDPATRRLGVHNQPPKVVIRVLVAAVGIERRGQARRTAEAASYIPAPTYLPTFCFSTQNEWQHHHV